MVLFVLTSLSGIYLVVLDKGEPNEVVLTPETFFYLGNPDDLNIVHKLFLIIARPFHASSAAGSESRQW